MLILLDIDGVMVSAKSWSSPMILEDGFSVFKPKAVEALNIILSETNANIVLTTSHKYKFSLNEWKSIFKKRNIEINNINRLPKNLNRLNRLQEINNWYATSNNVEKFVIIDDDKILHDLPKTLKNRWIATKPMIGLTPDLAKDAINIINRPLAFA